MPTGRVTQIQRYPVSTGAENVCQRAYFWYDTDKHDPSNVYGFQLQNGWGRVTSVEWYVSPSPACTSSDQLNGTRIVERYSYTSGGLVTKKRLHPMNVNTAWPNEAGGLTSSTSYMEGVYIYNSQSQMVSVKYPGDTQTSGPGRTYTYSFDSLSRPSKLTDDQATHIDWVKNVLYAPSGQMTQMLFSFCRPIHRWRQARRGAGFHG